GATMPDAKPPSARSLTVLAGLGLVRGSGCDRVKHAVNVVAVGIDATWTVSVASPSAVVNHSPTNMPIVELAGPGPGAPGHTVPPGVTIGKVSVTTPGTVTRPACPTSCCSSSVAPRTPLCISVRFQIVC